MSSTDDRIVKMQFDNAQFKKGAAETKESLDSVNKAIDSSGKNPGLLSLNGAMQRVSVTASKMAVITTTALATITNKAVNAGLRLASSLTLDPIKSGFHEYEQLLTKQNVIMNATGKSADQVKKVLNDLNHYSDKTIFSFGDMTEGMTSFVNAGVPLKDAAAAMKGIANASALAGASTLEAQSSFRAFGQAMGNGFLGLQDFRQAAVTGKIGTVQFKQTLIDAAVAAGTLTKKGKEYVTASGKSLTATKNFDNSLQEQWANTEVLNDALGRYADQNTKLGKKAFTAATEVRTFSAFIDTLKEGLGSGWSAIFTTIIGGLEDSTKLWTSVSNAVGEVVFNMFNFIDTTVATFKALGGFQKIWQGIKNIISPVVALFKAVGTAWREVFPAGKDGAGGVLFKIASGFEVMTRPLAWLAGQMPKLTPIFATFFKIVKMGVSSLSGAAHLIGDLVGQLTDLMNIQAPGSGGFSKFFDKIKEGASNLLQFGKDAAKNFVEGFASGFTDGSFNTTANIIGAGLLGGIFLSIRKLMKGGLNFNIGDGLVDNINESFGALTGTLKSMQTQVQAKTLMEIAIAIGLITASVIGLSFVDGDKLTKALAALAVGFGQLLLAFAVLTKISGSAGFIKMPLIAASLVLLAGAIFLLTAAVALMGQLKWETIGKGLAGIGGALVVIAVGMKLMPANLPITAAGLVLVGVALNAIAGAIAIMGNLEWETIGKGLATTAGALIIIAGAMQLMPVTMPITAAGLVLVGVALNAIGAALKIMGGMSWDEIGKGLTTLGGAMAILALGLNAMSGTLLGSAAMAVAAGAIAILVPSLILMGKLSWKEIAKGLVALAGGLAILAVALYAMTGSIAGAAALLIVAPALLALSTALAVMGELSWEQLAVGLVGLAAGLTVIGVAGALLTPVIPSLLGLGAALTLLGAGLALAGVGILAFSTGLGILVTLGAGAIAVIGKYIGAFLSLLPDVAKGVVAFLKTLVQELTQQAPIFWDAAVKFFTGLIEAAEKLLPKLGGLLTAGLKTLVDVVRKYIPNLAKAGVDIIIGLLRGIGSKIGDVVSAAVDLIIKFAEGIANNAIKLVNAGINMIAKFLHGLASAIRGGSGAIGSGLTDVLDAMKDVGVNMVKGLIGGITDMSGDALGAIGDIATGMINKAKGILKIFSPSRVFYSVGNFLVKGLTNGIQDQAAAAINAVGSMVSGQIAIANEYISKYIQDLDQTAIAARARADGLAAAARVAQAEAAKTKNKKDDKRADALEKQAEAASRAADTAEATAERAKDAQDRKAEFDSASTLEKAQMRSEDAQNQLDLAKSSESAAARDLQAAQALEKQAKGRGITAKERKALNAQAAALRRRSAQEARDANEHLANAHAAAADALALQKQAGEEASLAFQQAFDADAKAAADEAAFEKLSSEDKAKVLREQAVAMQKKADDDLAAAKKLAFTDLEAANELAGQAIDEAQRARDLVDQATDLENQAKQGAGTPGSAGAGGAVGTVVNLDVTDQAARSMQDYADLYDAGTAAAAAGSSIEFNQYNTSPEALSPTEIYRQTNNLFTYAVEKIDDAA